MFEKLLKELNTIPLSDKIHAGVALFIVLNPGQAQIIGAIVLTYFIYVFGKQIKGKL